MPVSLRLEGVSKRYGDHVAVDNVSLVIGAGKFVTLLGPSGSGKTTLLMMIAGFARPSSGHVFAGDREITNLAPEQRDFGMVFQGYALFPNMTVAENLAFPLKLRKMPRADITREVERMLETVRLGGLGRRYPRELSGGQQQRVALARALIFNPQVLLLDESLSALDKKLRAGLQEELRDLQTRLGTTFVFVTHDQDEALSMSDEIVIINHGRIMQRGSPKALYDRPGSHFVADFLGRANFIDAVVVGASARDLTYGVAGQTFRQALRDGEAAPPAGAPVLIGLRPEQMTLTQAKPADGSNMVVGEIASRTYEGADYHVRLSTPVGLMQVVVAASQLDDEPVRGARVWLSWRAEASVVLRNDR